MLVESLRDARDPRSVFDGFAYDLIEVAGGMGYIGSVDGEQVIVFACLDDNLELTDNDLSVIVGPIESADSPTILAAAEATAHQMSCVPAPMAPFECLGIGSDPAACNE
jgi:hypothetical protein